MDKIGEANNNNDDDQVNSLGIGNSAPYIPPLLSSASSLSFFNVDQYLHDDVIRQQTNQMMTING
jgi:hypothetical protein